MHIRSPRDLGLVVRAERRAQEMTQAELAARAGVTREWIVGLEKGNRGAEVGRVLQVLGALRLAVYVPAGSAAPRPNAKSVSRIDAIVAKAARRAR